MEEKNMVEFEDVGNVDEIEETEENTPRRSGIGTFGAMAIGSGLTLGGIALFKKLKKVMAAKKAAKEAAAETSEVIEVEVVETTDPHSETQEEQPAK
ncbi:hypothetical protein [uncultured Oscillibacter sp.]|uniref:hypothetical protein n=1 Tax=uncultured Oscillibacter sp. TaxID=876091 RepID=UPI0025D594E8|nr:hypothetical protein [uncultured Oscillibacter sp.]